jgi:hypothetical protein
MFKPDKKKQVMEFGSRILLFLVVILMIAFTIWASGPIPDKNAELTPTATPNLLAQNNGAAAVEFIEKTPTTGVIYAGLLVVVILLVGVGIATKTSKD